MAFFSKKINLKKNLLFFVNNPQEKKTEINNKLHFFKFQYIVFSLFQVWKLL